MWWWKLSTGGGRNDVKRRYYDDGKLVIADKCCGVDDNEERTGLFKIWKKHIKQMTREGMVDAIDGGVGGL